MARNPRVLGAFVKTHLQVIDAHSDDLSTRVRMATDPQVLAAVEKSSRISWLPIASHIALTESLFNETAPADARELCRQVVLEGFRQPLLRPIFGGALAVGSELHRFVRWAPNTWPGLFRDTGTLSWIEDGPGAGRLLIEDAAPEVLRSPDYIEGFAGAFSAFFQVTRSLGDISATAAGRRIEFSLSWKNLSP